LRGIFIVLNFYYTFISYVLVFLYYFFLSLPQWYITQCLNTLDVLSRSYFDEFFFNIYYYFWTSFFFVFIINYFINLVLVLFSKIIETKYFFFNFILLISLFLGLYEYWNLSNGYVLIHNNANCINKLLLNSINKYHPFIFYVSNSLLFLVLFSKITLSWRQLNSLYCYNILLIQINSNPLKQLYFIFVSLFLGGWWALQEGSWGGWWNWDASEVFGLLVAVAFLVNLHFYSPNESKLQLIYKLRGIILVLLLTYVFI
jgi:cytochrome c biogenesis factor